MFEIEVLSEPVKGFDIDITASNVDMKFHI
jgi:hypothetical protein